MSEPMTSAERADVMLHVRETGQSLEPMLALRYEATVRDLEQRLALLLESNKGLAKACDGDMARQAKEIERLRAAPEEIAATLEYVERQLRNNENIVREHTPEGASYGLLCVPTDLYRLRVSVQDLRRVLPRKPPE